MTSVRKSEAIVLRKRMLLNKDLLITLFTSQFGKIQAVAKGIRKITSRRSPHIQTGNFIGILLQQKKEHFFLQETNLISAFSRIKDNEEKIHVLYFFLFVLERLLPENQKEMDVFYLAKKFLITLSKEEGSFLGLLTLYLNKTLHVLGYSKEDKKFDELKPFIEDIICEKLPSLVI